ncbi:MAG: transporter, partial [Planctomycetota bacterium]
GLTPPEDRWIIRNQVRYMTREDDPTGMNREMSMYAFPTVVAYGLRPELTVLARQAIMHSKMTMPSGTNKDTGLNDLFVLGKYKLYRKNTREYTFGLAATLGVEFPTGADAFTSDTWDLEPGLFASWRSGPWASDFNIAYKWNGFADHGKDGLDPGDELKLNLALGHQFSVREDATASVTPVVELTYLNIAANRRNGHNLDNSGEDVIYVSPGMKATIQSFIIEGLLQIPVWQDQKGNQLERGVRIIVGTRVMF